MIASIAFSLFAAGLIWFAGRKDAARDPRLTLWLIALVALLPVLSQMAPKLALLPAMNRPETDGDGMKIGIAVWIAVSGFLWLRLLLAAVGLSRWWKRSRAVGEIEGVTIRQLEGLRSPIAAGIRRKTIFVPETWALWKDEERNMVLRHELAHHRRRDPLARMCVEMIRAALWWNPWIHWMAGRFHLQCEYACDESVVRQGAEARSYANLLCGMAGKQQHAPLALAMASPSSLQLRVKRMLRPVPRLGLLGLSILGLLGATTACALSMLGARTSAIPKEEIRLRLTADPFPGNR